MESGAPGPRDADGIDGIRTIDDNMGGGVRDGPARMLKEPVPPMSSEERGMGGGVEV